jgi:uncharacterized membrane protein
MRCRTNRRKEEEMATINAAVEASVPVSVAYDQWTQFEEFPQFMEGVVEVRQLDDKTTHWVAEVGGEREEWDAEIVEQQPDRVIAWRSLGGVEHAGRVTFEPTDEGTRVSVQMEWEPSGMKESAGAAMGLDERRVEKDLERFRDLVETRGTPTGAWRGEIDSGRVVDDS